MNSTTSTLPDDLYHSAAGSSLTLPLTLTFALALCSFPVPVLLLAASRKLTGGAYSVEMIYTRAFFVTDFLLTVYGMSRPAQSWIHPKRANCFLSETLLSVSFIASNVTLLTCAIDCRIRASRSTLVSKTSTIFGLILVWNCTFVVGFLPQMELSSSTRGRVPSCDLYEFAGFRYLLFTGAVFVVCTLVSLALVTHLCLKQRRGQVQLPASIRNLLLLMYVELAVHAAFSLPAAMYVVAVYAYLYTEQQYYLYWLVTCLQLKPVVAAFARCRVSAKLRQIAARTSRLLSCCCPPASRPLLTLTSSEGGVTTAYVIKGSGVVNEAFVGEPSLLPAADQVTCLHRKRSRSVGGVGNAVAKQHQNTHSTDRHGYNGLFPPPPPMSPSPLITPTPLNVDPYCPLHGEHVILSMTASAATPPLEPLRTLEVPVLMDPAPPAFRTLPSIRTRQFNRKQFLFPGLT